MKYDVITIGGITDDIMFYTDEMQVIKNRQRFGSQVLFAFESGGKIVSNREVIYTAGGGGANSAVSFARLGLRTGILAALGDDLVSNEIIAKLKKDKVNLDRLQRIRQTRTGLSFVITGSHKNEHIIFSHRAANEKLNLNSKHFSSLKTDWFYLTSLSGPYWRKNLELIFNQASKNKIKVAWNPGGTQLKSGYKNLKKYLALTSVLILNREEAMELVFNSGCKVKNTKKLLQILSQIGPKVVSISDGIKGAHVYSDGRYYFRKALSVVGVNTTGAGDAFGSSLVGGLILYQNDLKKALDLAIIRSNYVVREIGAQEGLLTLN